MKKIGIDLGSSSIGWAIREEDTIIKKGVVTFSTGMSKGTGGYSSPAKDRRESRSKRNLIRARKYRKWALLKILCENEQFVPLSSEKLEIWTSYKKGRSRKFPEHETFKKWLACDFRYENGVKYKNPYALRVKALDEKLTPHEFGRVLYHLVQRRGYKDIGEKDKETETQIKRRGESGFQKSLEKNRTIAEALKNDFLDKELRARDQYPYRNEYQHELEVICKAQGYDITKEGKDGYLDPFVLGIWKAIIWQRPLKSQKGSIGKCTLEPSKLRCAVSHPAFEISRAWQFINTIKVYNQEGEKEEISQEFRNDLFLNIFLKKKENFRFEDIKNYLDKRFQKKKKYNYPVNGKTGKYETTVSGMPFCKGLIGIYGAVAQKALLQIENYTIGNAPKIIMGYSILDIWHAVFSFDEEYLEKFALNKLKTQKKKVKRNKKEVEISPLVILKNELPIGYGDLSVHVLNKIIPFLKEGYLYNEAVVLSKLPTLMGKEWTSRKEEILRLFLETNKEHLKFKKVIAIANNLIDSYKGELEDCLENGGQIRAYKDYTYTLTEQDAKDITEACKKYFGEESWSTRPDKESWISEVGQAYQEFFFDSKRAYRVLDSLTNRFKEVLKRNNITLNGELYHHSQRKNVYGTKVQDYGTGLDVLPIPYIDSIKNPMFNKAMSVLRKLINHLIKNGEIDEDTAVIVEVARDLNDNNKRKAIEKYQKERSAKRAKIREFLDEFKIRKNIDFNTDERIRDFELWSEQIFGDTADETGQKAKEILSEKKAIKRYELWMEQKGQCMYTGKMISISQLFSNDIDIEHTIPRTLLPDNTMANLTVAYASYNRKHKGKLLPFYCPNYNQDTKEGTAIFERLAHWKRTRDAYKSKYEKQKKAKIGEDEIAKNNRIVFKHYFKMHLDYWNEKISRFTSEEITNSFARRQLVDTQMVSKYAREYLKTYFKKVAVQKGIVTAQFRKIYGFQEQEEIKSRDKHTHHAIDAAVLTLIPANSSRRDAILNKMYNVYENEKRQYTTKPFKDFNAQKLIAEIENETLIVNYEKDKILIQTSKNKRNRGRLQYVKDAKGEFVRDEQGNKIIEVAQGDTIRSTLYKESYLGKIKNVKRDKTGKPLRANGDWEYEVGGKAYSFTQRKPLKEVLSKYKDIIDPAIREIVAKQKGEATDPQGNKIRHVRIKTNAGQMVKKRINYMSKHEYKNFYYSQAGSIPYAIMLQINKGATLKRKMIPIPSFEVAKVFQKHRRFTTELYMAMFHPELEVSSGTKVNLLKKGQKVFVLNSDKEFEEKENIEFQKNRLYRVTKFQNDGKRLTLQHHLEARTIADVRKGVNETKHKVATNIEAELGIVEITENTSIVDSIERKKDFEKRKYDFKKRLKNLEEKAGNSAMLKAKELIENYQTEYSSIPQNMTPSYLLLSTNHWNFLYENDDFEISLSGDIKWLNHD